MLKPANAAILAPKEVCIAVNGVVFIPIILAAKVIEMEMSEMLYSHEIT
jgi:hypothetical protein